MVLCCVVISLIGLNGQMGAVLGNIVSSEREKERERERERERGLIVCVNGHSFINLTFIVIIALSS